MVPTLFPPHCAVILSGSLLGAIFPAKPNCLQRARNVEKYCMWSQVFVVQPADRMELASGLIACAIPLARAGWAWAAAWPGAARAAGANPTAAAAAPVKTVATRIAFREVVVLVAVFMNWPLSGMPLAAATRVSAR
jgi:hypothetical protein